MMNIYPMRIAFFNEFDFPGTLPVFNPSLMCKGFITRIVVFEPDQVFAAISFSKARIGTRDVLFDTTM